MVSDLDIYLFDLRGYLVLPNALTAEEVADLNACLDAIPPRHEIQKVNFEIDMPVARRQSGDFKACRRERQQDSNINSQLVRAHAAIQYERRDEQQRRRQGRPVAQFQAVQIVAQRDRDREFHVRSDQPEHIIS